MYKGIYISIRICTYIYNNFPLLYIRICHNTGIQQATQKVEDLEKINEIVEEKQEVI